MLKTFFLLLSAGKLGKVLTTCGTMLLSVFAYTLVFGWRYAVGLVGLVRMAPAAIQKADRMTPTHQAQRARRSSPQAINPVPSRRMIARGRSRAATQPPALCMIVALSTTATP